MSKTNQKNIIWNDGPNNTHIGFCSIETPENVIILQHKNTGELITVDNEQQRNELINARPCYHTDINWKKPTWFYDEFFGHNNIKMDNKVRCRTTSNNLRFNGGFTLGQGLKKMNKIEFLFPEGSEILFSNNYYYDNGSGAKTLDLKYKTSRKFKGFTSNGFEINKPTLFDNFRTDSVLAELISYLRSNGFIFFVEDTSDPIYEKQEDGQYKTIGYTKFQQALGYGHGLRIGISESNNLYNGYSYGIENILYDKDEEFNKWSQCYEVTKPKSKSEFENIFNTLIEHSKS